MGLAAGADITDKADVTEVADITERHTLRAGRALQHGGQAGIADRLTLQTG